MLLPSIEVRVGWREVAQCCSPRALLADLTDVADSARVRAPEMTLAWAAVARTVPASTCKALFKTACVVAQVVCPQAPSADVGRFHARRPGLPAGTLNDAVEIGHRGGRDGLEDDHVVLSHDEELCA